MICSFPRQTDSWVFDDLYRAGKIELEVVPQGNLAERMRAAGAGIGALLLPHRRRHAAGRGQGDPRDRRPRLRAGVPDHGRRRADRRAPRRPDGQPRLPQDRPQLRAGDGHRRATTAIAQVRGSSRSASSTRRSSSPRASTSTGRGRASERASHDERHRPRPAQPRRDRRSWSPATSRPARSSTSASASRPWSPTTSTAELRRRAAHRERHARHGPGGASATRSTPT